ncbi:hypothetical protein WDU94_005087 [Cyamophila willieti]
MKEEGGTLVSRYVKITFAVSLYWVISIITVFVNKALLSELKLDAPMFITWFQCLISAFLCIFLHLFSLLYPKLLKFPSGNPFKVQNMINVLPLSILFMSMITFNNLCLKNVGVSFYYIGRSLTTVFNVMFSYLLLAQKTSLAACACCGVIVMGFWLGVDQEDLAGTFSISGTVYGVLASASLALYSIHTKKVLPSVDNEIWLLSYFNNVYSSIILLILSGIFGELKNVQEYTNLYSALFWGFLSIGGLCGFAIGYVTTLQIKVTSPLTHNISGTAKACAQTVIASYWYHEVKPFLWWISNWVVLLGSAAYTFVKQREMEANYSNKYTRV